MQLADPRVAVILSDQFRLEGPGDWLGAIADSAKVTTFANLRDAVVSMRKRPFDIIVSIDTFPETHGRSLVKGLGRLCPNASMVILAANPNPDVELQNQANANPELSYFEQPWEQEQLTSLLKTLVKETEPASQAAVPSINDKAYQEISQQLEELQNAISALSLYLVNSLGQVLAYEGRDDLVQIGEVASLLGGSFAALQEVGSLLGEEDPSVNLIHRQGSEEDLYALSVGERYLLVLRVPSGTYAPKIGTVWYYARKTSTTLAKLLAEMQPQSGEAFSQENIEDELNMEFDNLFTGNQNGDGPISSDQLMDFQSALDNGLIPENMLGATEDGDGEGLEAETRDREAEGS